MGKVDHLHHAHDQREAKRNKGKQQAEREPVHNVGYEFDHENPRMPHYQAESVCAAGPGNCQVRPRSIEPPQASKVGVSS